jgi:hypothetical protein
MALLYHADYTLSSVFSNLDQILEKVLDKYRFFDYTKLSSKNTLQPEFVFTAVG